MGRYPEALHELDVALALARDTWTSNVLLEFLHYDRSVVLYALGDTAGAGASYRRYVQLVGRPSETARNGPAAAGGAIAKRPLEPYFLKRADQFIREHAGATFTVASLAAHCGVSERTLQKAFVDFRGVTPIAHVRNARLDLAHHALAGGHESVHDVAALCGFRSVTTFALEYRKRFGTSPSHTRRVARER
jgi:transcriptional regulator GlxA family with amidase domain